MLEAEGWDNVFARHQRIGEFTRRGVLALGLELLADQRFPSNTVTAVRAPEGIDVSALRKMLREEHGVVLAGGQGPLTGKIVRIGHLGVVPESDISEALSALGACLSALGFRPAARV
jgi:aspartate aminotransferase-like enzyme